VRTGQALFIVRCAFWLCSDSARAVHTLFTLLFIFADDRCAVAIAPLGAPDSPANYSGVALQKPEAEEFGVYGPWCTGHCPVAHQTVRCGRLGQPSVSFCSFLLNPNLFFLLVCVEPMAPVEHII
jgi:hypothetical protein